MLGGGPIQGKLQSRAGTSTAAEPSMITICLIAYVTVTSLFLAGLALAASRPTPPVPSLQALHPQLAHAELEDAA